MIPDNFPSQFNKAYETLSVTLPGGLVAQPSYVSAGAIVILLFLLVLTLGQLRSRLVHWSYKGLFPGIFFGFALAIILEGFLLIHGSTAVTAVLGWKSPPEPVAKVLDDGKTKLTKVLDEAQIEVNQEQIDPESSEEIITNFSALTDSQKTEVKAFICRE